VRRVRGAGNPAHPSETAKSVAAGPPRGSDYGLVDVNHASAAALTRLPGITQQLAGRIVGQRAQVGGFTSAGDLGVLLDLSPDIVDGLRDTAIFPPG
jgi:DNA uptake protein ComE-like DNA-binding protein